MGGFGETDKVVSRDFFNIFFDAWFDSPSRYRFLVVFDPVLAALRDPFSDPEDGLICFFVL